MIETSRTSATGWGNSCIPEQPLWDRGEQRTNPRGLRPPSSVVVAGAFQPLRTPVSRHVPNFFSRRRRELGSRRQHSLGECRSGLWPATLLPFQRSVPFGVVFYEMVTGRPLFRNDTLSDTLVSVLKEEPDWNHVPTKMRRLLRSCLQKDPKKRLRDISDVWLLIDETDLDLGSALGECRRRFGARPRRTARGCRYG